MSIGQRTCSEVLELHKNGPKKSTNRYYLKTKSNSPDLFQRPQNNNEFFWIKGNSRNDFNNMSPMQKTNERKRVVDYDPSIKNNQMDTLNAENGTQPRSALNMPETV